MILKKHYSGLITIYLVAGILQVCGKPFSSVKGSIGKIMITSGHLPKECHIAINMTSPIQMFYDRGGLLLPLPSWYQATEQLVQLNVEGDWQCNVTSNNKSLNLNVNQLPVLIQSFTWKFKSFAWTTRTPVLITVESAHVRCVQKVKVKIVGNSGLTTCIDVTVEPKPIVHLDYARCWRAYTNQSLTCIYGIEMMDNLSKTMYTEEEKCGFQIGKDVFIQEPCFKLLDDNKEKLIDNDIHPVKYWVSARCLHKVKSHETLCMLGSNLKFKTMPFICTALKPLGKFEYMWIEINITNQNSPFVVEILQEQFKEISMDACAWIIDPSKATTTQIQECFGASMFIINDNNVLKMALVRKATGGEFKINVIGENGVRMYVDNKNCPKYRALLPLHSNKKPPR